MKLRGLAACALIGCSSPAQTSAKPTPPPPPRVPTPSCLADEIGAVRNPDTLDTSCTTSSCKQACDAGDAAGCLIHAYALQRAEAWEDAEPSFERACKLGLAIACTNHGAWLFKRSGKSAPSVACAKRLFEKACEVREPFGCGMIGRLLASRAKTDEQRLDARLHFEHVCRDIGMMTCSMYAYHVENGDLGPPDPALVKSLLERACSTGDQAACGKDKASELFHK